MGQILDTSNEPRTLYDEEGDNGLLFGDKYIPEELIAEILCYLDYKSLLKSQLVCKRWKMLTESYVWRKKAEAAVGRSLQRLRDAHWSVYYTICEKKPFGRNLMKNHSGQDGTDKHWIIVNQGGDHWRVESPPSDYGVPSLPAEEPMFKGKQYCFATSYNKCSKWQTIDLESEGLPSCLLDTLQPPIVVGEWYSSRWDCPAAYECSVTLLGERNKKLDVFEFRRSMEDDDQNKWHHVSHEFTNYGVGLKKILFYHSGIDNLFWAGHYGSKMAGASVIVKIPDPKHDLSTKIESLFTSATNGDLSSTTIKQMFGSRGS